MKLSVEVKGKGADREVRVTGDPGAFFWLLNAAGAAQSGIDGNEAALADGGRIVLVPERPAEAQPRAGRTPLRTSADLTG